jgi:glycosyltransferase involved in cell wall biosynthesis
MTLTEWFTAQSKLTSIDRFLIVQHLESFYYKPKISLVVPVYNTKAAWLTKCFESVKSQLYTNWEMCVCDNGSTDQSTKEIIAKQAENEPRIKITCVDKNEGIAKGTNVALDLAIGDYCAFLDSDDELLETSLYLIVEALNRNHEALYLYTDEMIIDGKENCINSFFKPDWSPDLLRSQCYTNHLSVYETHRLRKHHGVWKGFDGSQDYDLMLRFTEDLEVKQIEHIPTVCYLWRSHPTSAGASNESYAIAGAVRALESHLQRLDLDSAEVLIDWPWYRVKYKLPDPAPEVGLLICSINKNGILFKCISDILAKTVYPNYKIYLCVTEEIKQQVYTRFRELVDSFIIRFVPRDISEEYNYSKFANRLVEACTQDIVCLMNDDIEPMTDSWLEEMVTLTLNSKVGVVGAKLLYPNMNIQHAGAVLGIGGNCAHVFKNIHYNTVGYHGRAKLINNYTVVTGAVSVIKKQVYQQIGGYPEEQAVAFNDVDFCIRLVKAGYRNIYTPYAVFIHYESATRGYDITPEQKAIFVKEDKFLKDRWKDFLLQDPYYNPNLSLESIIFDVAQKPRYKKPWLR